MNKEIPKPVWITLAVIGAIGAGYGIWKVGFAGPTMSAEDLERAEMQAQAANQRLQGYVPAGTPGAPPSGTNVPGEMEARQKMGKGN